MFLPSENEHAFSHVVVRKRVSSSRALAVPKKLAVIAFLAAIATFVISFYVLLHFCAWGPFCGFVIGFFAPLTTLFVARGLMRYLDAEAATAEQLTAALAKGESEDPLADLHKVIDIKRKRKEITEAEYYSRRLMTALAEAASGKIVAPADSTDCYVSTPAHAKSWRYTMGQIFESRGRLLLTERALEFTSPRIDFFVSLDDIVDLSVQQHSRWINPYGLSYLSLRFWYEAEQHEVLITPCSLLDTVWEINERVNVWKEKIDNAPGRQRLIKSLLTDTAADRSAAV